MSNTRRQFQFLRLKITLLFAGISFLIIICFNVAVFGSFSVAAQFFAESINLPARQTVTIFPSWLGERLRIEKVDPEITYDHQKMILNRFSTFQTNFRRNIFIFDLLIFLMSIIVGYYYSYYVLRPVEQSIKKQEDFILDASHELKTPIATIMAEIDALRLTNKDELTPAIDESLKIISLETQNLSDLSQSLLDLSKLDGSEIQMAEIDWSELVKTSLGGFKSLALKKNITLTSRISPSVLVLGNRQQLSQLLTILLDNALKYTPSQGKIRVSLRTEKKLALLEVQDTGIGIPRGQQRKIFQRFYRFKDRDTINEEGSGLGLAIASQIVMSHRGQIKVVSQPGKGSVFQVSLPVT